MLCDQPQNLEIYGRLFNLFLFFLPFFREKKCIKGFKNVRNISQKREGKKRKKYSNRQTHVFGNTISFYFRPYEHESDYKQYIRYIEIVCIIVHESQYTSMSMNSMSAMDQNPRLLCFLGVCGTYMLYKYVTKLDCGNQLFVSLVDQSR